MREVDDDIAAIVDECIKMLDQNVDILNDLDYTLQSEKEDIIVPELTKTDLADMAHEVSDSSRIKRAEYDFVRRILDNNLDK